MKKIKLGLQKASAVWLIFISILSAGCSSDSDEEEPQGFVKFYNASVNSPAIFLTIDENLEEDEDDEVEATFSAIQYGSALNNQSVPVGQYFYELAWQSEDSRARSDLEIVYEDQLQIREDEINLLVMYGDTQSPQVNTYDIALIDDEDDTDDDLFNLRFLNVAADQVTLDVYMSKSDETFNEAVYMSPVSFLELSDNFKLAEDQYNFYLTAAGSNEVVFESTEVNYPFTNQYIVVIRQDSVFGNANYVIDNVGTTGVSTYQAANAQSGFRVYNGVQQNALLPNYSGQLNLQFDSFDNAPIDPIGNLPIGQFSERKVVENGDFSIDIADPETGEVMVSRQLISLEENTDKTIFYYSIEAAVDDDGDGDFDEDGDGQIDQKEVKIESVVVENSTRERIFDHEVKLLNLAYSEDFDRVSFYFVKSDERISTTDNVRSTTVGTPTTMVLLNNTYDVFAIADLDGTDTILDTQVLVLNESSQELYMLLEPDIDLPSGFGIRVVQQIPGN